MWSLVGWSHVVTYNAVSARVISWRNTKYYIWLFHLVTLQKLSCERLTPRPFHLVTLLTVLSSMWTYMFLIVHNSLNIITSSPRYSDWAMLPCGCLGDGTLQVIRHDFLIVDMFVWTFACSFNKEPSQPFLYSFPAWLVFYDRFYIWSYSIKGQIAGGYNKVRTYASKAVNHIATILSISCV